MILGHIEWVRRFDAAIAKGRGTAEAAPERETAIAELKALGLTEGDAIFYLDRKRHA